MIEHHPGYGPCDAFNRDGTCSMCVDEPPESAWSSEWPTEQATWWWCKEDPGVRAHAVYVSGQSPPRYLSITGELSPESACSAYLWQRIPDATP